MPWVRRDPEEVETLRRNRRKAEKKSSVVWVIVICGTFALFGWGHDYYGDQRISLPIHLATWLLIAGLMIIFEPLFETRFVKFLSRFFWYYTSAKQRVKRNLYAGVPINQNMDLDMVDQVMAEEELVICPKCRSFQIKNKKGICNKCSASTSNIDHWKWLDLGDETEPPGPFSEEEFAELTKCVERESALGLPSSSNEKDTTSQGLTKRRRQLVNRPAKSKNQLDD